MSNKEEKTIEIYKVNLKSDKQQKANLLEELKLLEDDLKKINDGIKKNTESLGEIIDIERYLRSAVNNMEEAITDVNGYFQGNLADSVINEYGHTKAEITELYNSFVKQYGNVDIEVEELKAKKKVIEQKIEDIKAKIAKLNNNIVINNEALGKLQKKK